MGCEMASTVSAPFVSHRCTLVGCDEEVILRFLVAIGLMICCALAVSLFALLLYFLNHLVFRISEIEYRCLTLRFNILVTNERHRLSILDHRPFS